MTVDEKQRLIHPNEQSLLEGDALRRRSILERRSAVGAATSRENDKPGAGFQTQQRKKRLRRSKSAELLHTSPQRHHQRRIPCRQARRRRLCRTVLTAPAVSKKKRTPETRETLRGFAAGARQRRRREMNDQRRAVEISTLTASLPTFTGCAVSPSRSPACGMKLPVLETRAPTIT